MADALKAVIVGGGMITADLILPSVYHLQRVGLISDITVCALRSSSLVDLASNLEIARSFPHQSFIPCPSLQAPPDKEDPLLYREVLSRLPPRQLVVVALPDQLHYDVVMTALGFDQHVLCVKPLVLKYSQAVDIEKVATDRGLFVGIEYHKRFDRRSLVARAAYRRGDFGEFIFGEAKLIEPYYYRESNFQNWFTYDQTDPFTYVGCHYVDLVTFITGLRPSEVRLQGITRRFPNGKEGFLWSLGIIRWENGALLSVSNGLGYPDQAAGSNDQGLIMFCEGARRSAMIRHDDHDRGVSYAYLESIEPGRSAFNFVSPDFFRLVPWSGEGNRPVGYGYDSVASIVETVAQIERETKDLPDREALKKRRNGAYRVGEKGLVATPANSWTNELVLEAGRLSILNDGAPVQILYSPLPHVELMERTEWRKEEGGSSSVAR
jgi:predicted dehydrogenase